MISALLPCVLIALSVGDVRTIPAQSRVSEPGKLNWYIGDRLIPIPVPIRAMVVRVHPEGVEGVVEVKFFDGTNRFGWLEPTTPIVVAIRSPVVPQAFTLPSTTQAKPYAPRTRRRYPRQDHNAIAAMTAGMVDMASRDLATAAASARPVPFQSINGPMNERGGLIGSGGTATGGGFGGSGGPTGGGSHICGAVTKTTNKPCQRMVSGSGHCYQHQ